jgi:hypothetical protein
MRVLVDHDTVLEPSSTDDVESVLEGVIELREIGEDAHDPQTGDETRDVERPQTVRSSSIEPVRENGGLVWLYSSYCASISLARRKTKKLDKTGPVVHIARLEDFWTLD